MGGRARSADRRARVRRPAGDQQYLPAELQHDCELIEVEGQPQLSCQVRTTDCPGHSIGTACTVVPEIAAGDGVVLEGVNSFSTDAVVRLTNRTTQTVREVPAHVWGDVDTPIRETVNGQDALVNDCRVHDRLTFQVPGDLVPGPYEVRLVVPNITGIAAFGDALESNSEFIAVVPPPTARFEISSETLYARAETSPSWAGSDEVGFSALAIALNADLSTDPAPTRTRVRFGDVDSGETRQLQRVLFRQQQPILGVALSILGHEVDSEDAYRDLINDFTDIFVDLVKEQAKWVASALALVGGASALGKLGPAGWVIVGIGIAVTLAIDLIVALWAPADLIMEDQIGPTTLALTQLTSADFPAPETSTHRTAGGLSVNVTPVEKVPLQYRERREYVSSEEDSRYELTLRFNRVA